MAINSNILNRQEFDFWLLEWYRNTNEKTVCNASDFGQQAFLWVKDNDIIFRLNSDTKREGVHEYLQLLKKTNNSLSWSIVSNLKGKVNKVAFGESRIKIRGFYLYLAD